MKRSFQVRIPSDVHAKIKSAAKSAGISMNQLIEGVLEAFRAGVIKIETQEPVIVVPADKAPRE